MHYLRVFVSALLSLNLCTAAAPDPGRFHYVTQASNASGPCDLDTGPDNVTVWYRDLSESVMGAYNVQTKKLVHVHVPEAFVNDTYDAYLGSPYLSPCFVRTGKDGYIYSAAVSKPELIRLNPKTLTFDKFALPGKPYQAWAAETGLYITYATENKLSFFAYNDSDTIIYNLPGSNLGPMGIRLDAQGLVWFTNYHNHSIGYLNPATEQINLISLPRGDVAPTFMRAFVNDTYLYANAYEKDCQVIIDTLNKSVTLFPPKPVGGPQSSQNDADPEGRIWISFPQIAFLQYYVPSEAHVYDVHYPGRPIIDNSGPIHYGPLNVIWFKNSGTSQLGYYSLDEIS